MRFLIVLLIALFFANTATFAKTQTASQCTNVLDTVFECTTASKHKILVCKQKNRYEYRFIRQDKLEDTIINVSLNRLATYPLKNRQEALGFKTASQEYQVYAFYKPTVDAKNVFDDNIHAGVNVLRKNKKVKAYQCADTPDSISISDAIALKQKALKQKTVKLKTVKKQQAMAKSASTKAVKSQAKTKHVNTKKDKKASQPKLVKKTQTISKAKPLANKKQTNANLPKHVKNIEGLINFLGDDD